MEEQKNIDFLAEGKNEISTFPVDDEEERNES